jgi:hypothetical protein
MLSEETRVYICECTYIHAHMSVLALALCLSYECAHAFYVGFVPTELIHGYIHAYIYTYIHTYIHTYKHTYIHTC